MSYGQRPRFEAEALPELLPGASKKKGGGGSSVDILAVGQTDVEGCFVVYIADSGFQYLDLPAKRKTGKCWKAAGSYAGANISRQHGLHFRRISAEKEGEEGSAVVAFIDASGAFVSVRLAALPPSKDEEADGKQGQLQAEEVGRTSLSGEAVAVAAEDASGMVAVAFANGSLRCFDPAIGKAAGKSVKLDLTADGGSGSLAVGSSALAALSGDRFVVFCNSSSTGPEVHYHLATFDAEARQVTVTQSGSIGTAGPVPGKLLGCCRIGSAADEKVMLRWAPPSKTGGDIFVTASDFRKDGQLVLLPRPSGSASVESCAFAAVAQGYVFEGATSTGGALSLLLRDCKYGMQVCHEEVSLPFSSSKAATPVVATSGGFSVLLGASAAMTIRWELPAFALHMVVGALGKVAAAAAAPTKGNNSKVDLTPLREQASGKRPRDDADVAGLFSKKRRGETEKVLAGDLRGRKLRPSAGVVDAVLQHECWGAARALLSLPELEEEQAVRLLAARPQLLPRVVRRASSQQFLGNALRDHLPASQLKDVVEVLRMWLESYKEIPEAELRKKVSDLPSRAQIVAFLNALADGCLPSLARLEQELLEDVIAALGSMQHEMFRTEKLYGAIREATRVRAPMRTTKAAPSVEVMFLPF
eukprot:TRINITY_DN35478_c0_g1_i1.p1 TRINITY_DN35478_c0_g1~~TRINITY_DN35478_c0_g1_i1.p1  ORF type:complete len:645 (-),score=194.67 TRINITY_DN35478_c0_g1_i1:38-1972(-)